MNDVKLQEGTQPVDENLRPIKVGGKSTALETAQHGDGVRVNGDLEVVNGDVKLTTDDSGDITLDAIGGDVNILQADVKSSMCLINVNFFDFFAPYFSLT